MGSQSAALYLAAMEGHDEVVRLLLKDGHAEPADHGSRALWTAADNGHVGVVMALLKDGRADPTSSGNKAFRLAKEGERSQFAAFLEREIPRRKRWNSRWGTVHVVIQVSLHFDARCL